MGYISDDRFHTSYLKDQSYKALTDKLESSFIKELRSHGKSPISLLYNLPEPTLLTLRPDRTNSENTFLSARVFDDSFLSQWEAILDISITFSNSNNETLVQKTSQNAKALFKYFDVKYLLKACFKYFLYQFKGFGWFFFIS